MAAVLPSRSKDPPILELVSGSFGSWPGFELFDLTHADCAMRGGTLVAVATFQNIDGLILSGGSSKRQFETTYTLPL
jgi:hypothetical protein